MNSLDLKNCLVQITYQLIGAVFYGFGAFILLNKGYNIADVGVLLSLSGCVSIVLSPLIANYLDKHDRSMLFIVSFSLSSILFFLFYFIFRSKEPGLVLSIVFVFTGGIFMSLEPLLNLFAYSFKKELNYGMARAFGSLAYGTGCFLLGNVSVDYGEKKIIMIAMIVAIALTISIINVFDKKQLTDIANDAPEVNYKDFLKHNRHFVMMCAAIVLIFFSYFAIDNYMLVIVENVKGNSNDTGNILAIKAYLEVPIIFLYTKLVRRFSIKSLLKLSTIAFLIKNSLILLADSLLLIYLAQLLQGLSFGLLLPAMVDYVDRYITKKEANRGQSLFVMSMNVGSIIASFIAGYLCDNFGVSAMEMVALFVCMTGAIVFWILMDLGGKKI